MSNLESGNSSQTSLGHPDTFVRRHIGPRPAEMTEMLRTLGQSSLDSLADAAVPAAIRLNQLLNLPAAISEFEALAELRAIAAKNQVFPRSSAWVTATPSRRR